MKNKKKSKDLLLRSLLVISIIFSVFLVSNCDDLFNHIPIFPGHSGDTLNPPEFGGSEAGSFGALLFEGVAAGATEGIASAGIDWALSAMGLSSESEGPDYTEQLDKIDEDLQEIINQLNGIQAELDQINSELKVINCSEWQTNLTNEEKTVVALLEDYKTMVSTATAGGIVTNSTIRDWVDKVLAIGNYTSREPMEEIIAAFQTQLIQSANTGTLPACIQSISPPPEHSFGADTAYYNKVKLFTDFYYVYQVQALLLYNEAVHYEAWSAAGKPSAYSNSNYLSADSVSLVCSNAKAVYYCNQARDHTNQLYNSLIQQLTAAGAPFTDERMVLEYRQGNPLWWPLSLEDFTTAAGDNCSDPLNSSKPCGITVGWYNFNGNKTDVNMVIYKGYTGWTTAGIYALEELLAGWQNGKAGDYLENELGFKNMQNKIVISKDYVEITLDETEPSQDVVVFFDTDWSYDFLPGGPVSSSSQFQSLLTKSRSVGSVCGSLFDGTYFDNVDYTTNSNVPANRNHFYDAQGHARHCGGDYVTPFSFSVIPGYLAINGNLGSYVPSGLQFRWPVLEITNLTCTENRSNKNAGGVWTMCGDEFTAFLDSNVPRPPTCDDLNAGTSCIMSSSTVAKANSKFGDHFRSKRSF